jgi:hypothetical protein
MTIQDWGALGEIIGAIAVVASLVYLAIQIRQNTHKISQSIESTRLAAFERNVESGNRIRELILLNPDVADLLERGTVSFVQLPRTDKLRFDMLIRIIFSGMQGAHVRHLTVGGDPMDFQGSLRVLDSLLDKPGVQQWCDVSEPDWRPEFAALVAERLRGFHGQSDTTTEETDA